MHTPDDSILILDFGSQVTQLIARRIREAGVYCEIVPFAKGTEAFARMAPKGVILSGSPANISDENGPRIPDAVLAAEGGSADTVAVLFGYYNALGYVAQAAGAAGHDGLELVFGETDLDNPFVPVEQMMPFLPFVRCRDVDEAIQRAHESEHGFRHTAIIHSNDVRAMTRMGRLLDTTLFVKNGPSVAGLGLGGEGYLSFSIATPTGEGVTTPLTFTRQRRCTLVDDLRILGSPDFT